MYVAEFEPFGWYLLLEGDVSRNRWNGKKSIVSSKCWSWVRDQHDRRKIRKMNAHRTAFPAWALSDGRPMQGIEVDRSRWV